jgi:hypothetical protein
MQKLRQSKECNIDFNKYNNFQHFINPVEGNLFYETKIVKAF